MASIGDTQTGVLKQDLILQFAQRELIQSQQLLPTVYDVSQYAVQGVGKISFPRAGSFTVGKFTVPEDTQCGVPQVLTYAEDELTLDQHAFVCWSIKDKAGMQSMLPLEIDAAQRAGRAHAADLDKTIFEAIQAGASAVNVLTADDQLTRLLKLVTALKNNKVPMDGGNIFAVINPTIEQALLTSSSNPIIDASRYGNQLPLVNGEIGMLFGARIVVTTSSDETAGPIVYHREALAIGFQMAARLQQDYDVKCLETVYNMDQLYGLRFLNSAMAVKANPV